MTQEQRKEFIRILRVIRFFVSGNDEKFTELFLKLEKSYEPKFLSCLVANQKIQDWYLKQANMIGI